MTVGPGSLDAAAWASRWRTRSVAEKVLLTAALLGVGLSVTSWWQGLPVLATAVGVALFGARVPARLYLLTVLAPLSFILLSAATILVAIGTPAAGESIVGWGPLHITQASVAMAITLSARAFACTAALMVLATTTPMVDLLASMRRAHLPEPLIEVASLIYRLVFVLLEVAGAIIAAQAARLGYVGYRRSLRSAGTVGAVLLVRSWDRARRLEDGLAGRGYTGALRTLEVRRPISWPFVAMVVGLTAVLITLRLVLP